MNDKANLLGGASRSNRGKSAVAGLACEELGCE